jgi:hypothetical protein
MPQYKERGIDAFLNSNLMALNGDKSQLKINGLKAID